MKSSTPPNTRHRPVLLQCLSEPLECQLTNFNLIPATKPMFLSGQGRRPETENLCQLVLFRMQFWGILVNPCSQMSQDSDNRDKVLPTGGPNTSAKAQLIALLQPSCVTVRWPTQRMSLLFGAVFRKTDYLQVRTLEDASGRMRLPGHRWDHGGCF